MNLTEWITKEDLTIKEFVNVFVDVVIENFGTHNYKCVRDVINEKLSERQTTDKVLENHESKALSISDVVKSLPQENFCEICNLPTDGEKCYSKRCPI